MEQKRRPRMVHGDGLHLVSNRAGFPKLVQVTPASVSEKVVIDQQAADHQRLPAGHDDYGQ